MGVDTNEIFSSEISPYGRMIFRDADGNEFAIFENVEELKQDNDQENTQVTLDDMINESVDVYERRNSGDSNATYEDVDVHYQDAIHITDHEDGGFTAQVDDLNLDFLNEEAGNVGAFTTNEDAAITFVTTYNLPRMEERITALEDSVYRDDPETDNMLTRIGNLEISVANISSLCETYQRVAADDSNSLYEMYQQLKEEIEALRLSIGGTT